MLRLSFHNFKKISFLIFKYKYSNQSSQPKQQKLRNGDWIEIFATTPTALTLYHLAWWIHQKILNFYPKKTYQRINGVHVVATRPHNSNIQLYLIVIAISLMGSAFELDGNNIVGKNA